MIAVAGGKGGVGKSTIAANLGLALGRLGQRVVIVDADLGAANLHTMFGALNPKATLADFLDHRIEQLDGTVIQVGPSVGLVPGTSRPGSANLNNGQKLRFLKAMAKVDADTVLVDVGAGTSFNVVDVVAAADHKLFVLTPQLPSLHNAYALLKACVHRVTRKLSSDETHQSLIDSALGNEGKARTIPQLLAVLRPLDSVLADRIVDTLLRFGVGLVGNQLGSDAEGAVFGRISSLVYDHLLVHAPVVGAFRRSSSLAGSLRAGVGTIVRHTDEGYRAFADLARTIVDTDLQRLRGEERTAMQQTMPIWIQRELQGDATK
ncbi:MAG: P-loop NTPase [Kofleriaceae bacterium]